MDYMNVVTKTYALIGYAKHTSDDVEHIMYASNLLKSIYRIIIFIELKLYEYFY